MFTELFGCEWFGRYLSCTHLVNFSSCPTCIAERGADITVGQGTGRGGMGGTPGTIKALVAVMTVCDCMGCSWFMWRDQLGCCSCDGGLRLCCSWFMWRDQLGCCDDSLRLCCSWFMWKDQLGLQKGWTAWLCRYKRIKINNTCLGY